MKRVRLIGALVGPTARAMRWSAILPPSLLALGGFAMFEIESARDAITPLRLSALLIAVGGAFALEDPSEDTIACVPTRLSVRRALRVALVLPPLAASWAGLLAYARTRLPEGPGLPVRALWLEWLALVVVALSLAVLAGRRVPDWRGGAIAAPALLLLAGAAVALPDRVAVWAPDPGDPTWRAAHARWTWTLVIAAAMLGHSCLDPGRQSLRLRLLTALSKVQRRAA